MGNVVDKSGNPISFSELNNDQRRQLVDVQQLFEAQRDARQTWSQSYAGSMRWVRKKGREYLHKKRGKRERSLGPRSPATEAIHAAFVDGRQHARERIAALAARLERVAPVNRALGLGRIPAVAAKIFRMLDDEKLLGSHVLVVGTNAMFAYEARAGVLCASELLATGDADLLWDPRHGVALLSSEVRREGVIGLLQKTDRSFQQRGPGDFRAVNRDGYYVDLIRPEDHSVMQPRARRSIGDRGDDLHASPILGLQWLVNAPRFEAMALGSDGYPARLVTPDPRAFALHKLWLSSLPARNPLKRPRDEAQATAVARMCRQYLGLEFADDELQALPARLRVLITQLP
jgi:hypothetical protein